MTNPENVVVDASAIVDLLVSSDHAAAIRERIASAQLHAPAHFDAEVLSALGRINRAGALSVADVELCILALQRMPVNRHSIPGLLAGAWERRASIRLLDGLYVELADQLDVPLITADTRLAKAVARAEVPGQR